MNSSGLLIQRTNSGNKHFKELTTALDAELASGYDTYNSFYAQHNKIDNINHVVVVFMNGSPVACGAMKKFDEHTMEIKRMYTKNEYRGQGFATKILASLEAWAKELSFQELVLETGTRQLSALALYKKKGYLPTPNYGQYVGVVDSLCFRKILWIE